MFEQEYKRANDRIHPRKDLLKEMEAQWAAETAREAAEERKVVAFPAWAKYVSMAAGILLCVGLGMGSVLLFGRGRGMRNKTASAEAPMMAQSLTMAQEEEAKIITEAVDMNGIPAGGEALMESHTMLTAPAYAAPQGMHPAADEAEVEDAILYAAPEAAENEAMREADAAAVPVGTGAPMPAAKAGSDAVEMQYPAGDILIRDDLMAVFMPTAEQVRVLQYANRKVTKVFSLGLHERGAQVKRILWVGSEMLALREKNGETELLRTDVADWQSPRHLKTMTQSGTLLAAGEMDGRVYILSLYRATEEEPLPWVNGARIDYADVLLDEERPCDTFTVLTVYDPRQGDGFAAQKALLAEAQGAVAAADRLLVWAGTQETALYALSVTEGALELSAEGTRAGRVLAAGRMGDDFALLLQDGQDAALLTLDGTLNETAAATAKAVGDLRRGEIDGDGAIFLTEDALHMLTPAGDRSAAVSAEVFRRLTEDKILVFDAAGNLQLVAVGPDALEAKGTLKIWDSLALLAEDPSRLDFDPATGRLAFPAGQKVYQYLINDKGDFVIRGTPLVFYDHDETTQRELRCRLTEDRALLFYKSGVIICSQVLGKMATTKY